MNRFLITILAFLTVFSGVAFAAQNFTYSTAQNYRSNVGTFNDREKILFIVDFSNSMNERLNGRHTKIDVAISTMKDILSMLPPSATVGLRVYGHITSGIMNAAATLIRTT